MNVLSIGNSFSQDAQRYINKIADADKVNLNTFNLCIGGCSFSKHYRNLLGEKPSYLLEVNGVPTNFYVSIKEALLSQDWDYVTVQQVSILSTKYDTFQPYANEIALAIRKYCPKAKLLVHETWGYKPEYFKMSNGYSEHSAMYADLHIAYKKLAEEIKADGIIPSGTLINELVSKLDNLHRDNIHLSSGKGRYAVGLLWYKLLTGKSVINNSFNSFDEEISEEDIKIIKTCVENINY